MRYLLVSTEDSAETIPIEIPDKLVVSAEDPSLTDKPISAKKVQKHKIKGSEALSKPKKKIQKSKPYGTIHHSNLKGRRSK